MKKENNQKLGLLIVLFCGAMCGLSGVLGQLLFQTTTIPAIRKAHHIIAVIEIFLYTSWGKTV